MNFLRPRHFLLAALFVLACGKPVFYADLNEPRICKTVPNQSFPAQQNGQLQSDFDIPIGDILSVFNQSQNTVVDIELTELTLNAQQGITDFNGVDSAAVSVQAGADAGTIRPDGGLPGTVVLEYTKNPNNLPGRTVTVSPIAKVNLIDFIHSTSFDGGTTDGITLHAEMSGQLPTNDWTADVRGCISFDAKIYYLQKYGL